MTTLATDNYTRANQTGWGLASDGINTWSQAVSNNVSGGSASWSIAGDAGAVGNTNENVMLCGTVTQGNTEVLLECYETNSSTWFGATMRSSSDGKTCYQVIQNSGHLGIYRRNGTTYTGSLPSALTSVNSSTTLNVKYWMRARVTGNSTPLIQARIWQDGTTEPSSWQVTYTDSGGSAITTAGLFGVYLSPNSTTNDKCYNFSANDTTTGPTLNNMASEDDLVLSDTFLALNTTLPTDSLTLSDVFLAQDVALSTDALVVSDSLLILNQETLEDDLVLSDIFLTLNQGVFTESLSINDSFLVSLITPYVENLVLSSMFLANNQILFTDIIPMADNFSSQTILQVVETLQLSDGFVVQGLLQWTETDTISDVFAALQLQFMASQESLVISDGFTILNNAQFTESLAAIDVFVVTDLATFIDIVPISDSFSGQGKAAFIVLRPPATFVGRNGTGTVTGRSGSASFVVRSGTATFVGD